ncbi:MAG: hypothetical protein V3V96_05045 [Acidiferrobacterales bacterium]
MKKRTPVRHKSAGQPIWTAKRPERREGEGQGRPESIRVSVLDAEGGPQGENRPKAIRVNLSGRATK